MTVLVDDEHDEVVEEKLESGSIRLLASPEPRVVLVLDPLPARAPELAAVSISLPANIFSDVHSLPLLSLPLSLSLSFSFSLSRPLTRTDASKPKLPIELLPTDELPSRSHEEDDEDAVRVLDLPRDCGGESNCDWDCG